ncbi:Extended synaptotagmin-1 [Phytophthora pseudosyringae]|uniref:Extended synaptotagmin-1 n=1 Tax=Phytophthora pseudosyringae TaxID=221518 RepID=A0A8T1V7F6_9STRA|nr:Extended synaptotagmin-1 [Phytophthora pseudosyringae]
MHLTGRSNLVTVDFFFLLAPKHSLRTNREQWAVVAASLAVVLGSLAVGLARRQQSLQVASQSRALVRSDSCQRPTHRDSAQSQYKRGGYGAESDENGIKNTTVVEDMGNAVPSREQIRRGLRDTVLLPAARKALCVVCSAVMFYLGANGHVYVAAVAVFVMISLIVNLTELAATSSPSLSSKSKLRVLRGLDASTLNELLRDDLPHWVKFPDVRVAQQSRCQVVASQLRHGAPVINGIKCLESSDDERVTVDVDLLVVTQNSEVVVSLTNHLLYLGANVEISDFVLRGTLQVELKPLLPRRPTFGAVSVSFLENPTIDFQLKTLHINLMELPALSPTLRKAINGAVERRCLWPNKVLIPFVDDQRMLDMESLIANHPLGVLVIRGLRVSRVCPRRAFSRWSGAYSFCLHFSVGKESEATSTIRGESSSDFAGRSYQLLVIDPRTQDLNVTLERSEAFRPRKQIDSSWVRLDHLKPQVGYEEHSSLGCVGDRSAEFEVYWYPFARQGSSSQDEEEVVASLPDDIARAGVVFVTLL